MEFLDIPQQKSFADVGLDPLGQSPLKFSGAEINRKSQTMRDVGLPAKFIIDGKEAWIQKGQGNISLNVGQDIQVALDAVLKVGGGKVILNPGIYNVSKDLIIGSGVTLEGSGIFTSIIDFNGGPYSIRIEGSNPYSTGTVTVVQNSATVTGTNTIWTSDMVGQSILVDGDWYDIEAYVSPTELTLSIGFIGTNQAGLTYVIATLNLSATLREFTVQNSSTDLIKIRYTSGSTLIAIARYGGDSGINCQDSLTCIINLGEGADSNTAVYFNNVFSWTITTESYYNCLGNGFQCDGGGDSTILDVGMSNNGGSGVQLTNTSKISIISFTIDNNVSHGIEEVSGCDENVYSTGNIHDNGGDGIKFTATSDKNSISQSQLIDNTGYGINIAAATDDNNIILGNVFSGNGSGQVNNSGTGTLIRSNVGQADN